MALTFLDNVFAKLVVAGATGAGKCIVCYNKQARSAKLNSMMLTSVRGASTGSCVPVWKIYITTLIQSVVLQHFIVHFYRTVV